MNRKLLVPIAAFVLGFVAVLAGVFIYQQSARPRAAPTDVPALLWPNPKAIGEFELSDQNGKPFGPARLAGKWTFWYFGYTNCPDACPTTLAVFNSIDKDLKRMPELGDNVEFAFVSVDPARDSPAHLAEYVRFFNPDFIAATGTVEQIDAAARQFGVAYRLNQPDEQGNYVVDHTAAILLTDPEVRLVGLFQLPHHPPEIVQAFRRIRNFVEG